MDRVSLKIEFFVVTLGDDILLYNGRFIQNVLQIVFL